MRRLISKTLNNDKLTADQSGRAAPKKQMKFASGLQDYRDEIRVDQRYHVNICRSMLSIIVNICLLML